MSTMLNLVDRLLAMGRRLQHLGRHGEALDILKRLAGFRDLPADVAEKTQASLAAIQLRRGKYPQARRHLKAALAYQPGSAHYYHLLATSLDADEKASPDSALAYYRKSLELDPHQPDCQSEFGLLAVYLGHTEEGLQALRRAVELAPDDPTLVGKLLEALCQAEQPEEARRELRAALFRNARDRRFQKLWSDFQFRQLQEQQATARLRQRAAPGDQDELNLLPFLRSEGMEQVPGGKRRLVRRDPAHPPAAPHLPQSLRLPDQRHAQ